MTQSTEIEVIKSPADHREYKALQLPNGLRALLIRDPHIESDASKASNDPSIHAELIEDPETLSGDDEDDDEESGSESGSEDMETDKEDEDDHQHVRHHHPRAPHTQGPVKKAAAALSVGIGYYSDPPILQGLSHYLEHMVFMGSEKYPDENDYDAYLSAHSGSSNACTEEETTTFHFDCAPDALHDALDRFAQFFVAPLIKADALGREVLAVDNEFSGVLQNDACRMMQVRAYTSHAGHPASFFGWGNKKSLMDEPLEKGIDVRAELLNHYKTQYKAERMNLVLLGGESMDVMESWVKEKFSAVPSSGQTERPNYRSFGAPFSGGEMYALPAVRDDHRIAISFPFPCLEKEYTKKAEEYISHLIGHEGSGSLLAALKSKGWASELCAGITDQTSASWVFEVSVTLTEAGLSAHQGCGLAVVELFFQYLAMLRKKGPQKWAWEEMANIAQIKWKFLEEEDAAEYTAQIASDMHTYPLEHTLYGQYIHQEYDADLISSLLMSMTPSSARIDLQTRAFDTCCAHIKNLFAPSSITATDSNLCSTKSDLISIQEEEPWFKIPYFKSTIPEVILHSWTDVSISNDIDMPPRNKYLPTDFTIYSNNSSSSTTPPPTASATTNSTAQETAVLFPTPPIKILDQPGLSLWHKLDTDFKVPRIISFSRLSFDECYTTPNHAALTHLIVKLLEDSLCEEAYLADVAGLHYALWCEGSHGIDCKIEGFSHKVSLLAEFIFKSLAALQFTDEDFTRVKEALVRAYSNSNMKPLRHATYSRLRILKETLWDVRSVHDALGNATANDVRSFLPRLLTQVHIEMLVMGNITAEHAQSMGSTARCALGAIGHRTACDRVAILPATPKALLYRAPAVNAVEENCALEVYLQIGIAKDAKDRALLDFVDQLMYEPCYDTLRTKEQLGYTVSSGARLTHGVLGLCIVIQSGTYSASHLDERVELFLKSFIERLSAMDDAEFERNRQALISNKLMKDRNLSEEVDKAWDGLINRGADFYSRRDEVEMLKILTKEDIESFMKEKVVGGGDERRKLAVHIIGKGHVKELINVVMSEGVEVIDVDGIDEFKKTLTYYPRT